MGRDPLEGRQGPPVGVSIHAPAWGATDVDRLRQGDHIVSIHAPAWGATAISAYHCQAIPSFNPRARMGRDDNGSGMAVPVECFNPRARMGRDDISDHRLS